MRRCRGSFVRAAALAGELTEAARTLLSAPHPSSLLLPGEPMTKTLTPWSRAWRRAISRDEARKHAFYNGPAPRYEPARNDTCAQHHRQVPCTRCTQATAQ